IISSYALLNYERLLIGNKWISLHARFGAGLGYNTYYDIDYAEIIYHNSRLKTGGLLIVLGEKDHFFEVGLGFLNRIQKEGLGSDESSETVSAGEFAYRLQVGQSTGFILKLGFAMAKGITRIGTLDIKTVPFLAIGLGF
ncbi:MAG: hypothetical protein AAF489_17225, partial [Bacteroidota bacterium]